MGIIKEYINKKKKQKEINKHDKSYVKSKYILSIDEETGIAVYVLPTKR